MSSGFPWLPRAALGLLACAACAQAQERLEPVVVTGNALRSADAPSRVSVIDGDGLVLQRGLTLADTLRSVPGISSTAFGPNANRPVIRGLDGDRIRMMANSGSSIDASSLSFDHAVPIDPLVVERIEVLRGPGALLYGGNAIGGVVNAIDNRIPTRPIGDLGGGAEVRFGGAARERGGAALLEGGNGTLAWHADVFGRRTDDLRVPRPEAGRVQNSASRTQGGAAGVSATLADGYVGVSVDRFDSRYGIVAEPDVTIDMQRDQVAVAGEWRFAGAAPVRALRGRIGHTKYEHREIEGSGEVGTTFSSNGTELRLEAEHAPVGDLRGVAGVQWEHIDFAAIGEEAFVPSTTTRHAAVFLVEELPWAAGRLGFGARVERVSVASRRFTPASLSVSQTVPLGAGWETAVTLSRTERAPTSFELFADGVHVATAAFERGDPTLGEERGTQLDASLTWKQGPDLLRLDVFAARFGRYIALAATGATIDVPNDAGGVDSFPEFAFQAVRAQLNGFEIEARRRLLERPWTLDLSGSIDAVRATDRDSGEPLPRIAPLRVRLGMEAAHAGWTLRGDVAHAARQSRVPAEDQATPGHTLLGMSLWRKLKVGEADALFFVVLDNLTDRLAYNAGTINTVRTLAPLPGRSVKAGWRVTF